MKNSIFSIFTPRDYKFFPLLNEMADEIQEGAQKVKDCVDMTSAEELKKFSAAIRTHEYKVEKLNAKIFEELHNSFITPFDREDMTLIAERLDEFMDYIKSSGQKLKLYKPNAVPDEVRDMADLLHSAAEHVAKAVHELENLKNDPKRITDHCKAVYHIESRTDEIYEQFLSDIFHKETSAIEIIKLQYIMEDMERSADAAYRVARAIRITIVKYA